MKYLVLLPLLLSSLFLTSCRDGDGMAPYCPAAEMAVSLICGIIAPSPMGDLEAGDFDGITEVDGYNTVILQFVGEDGEARPVCLGEGCP